MSRGVAAVAGHAVRRVAVGLLAAVSGALAAAALLRAGLTVAPVVLSPPRRRGVGRRLLADADRVITFDRRRLRLLGVQPVTERRPIAYVVALAALGPPAGLLVAVGVAYSLGYLGWSTFLLLAGSVSASDAIAGATLGVVTLIVTDALTGALAAGSRLLVRRLLDPDPLRERIAELSASRAAVVEAVDAERRRIERDLHDGVQQRLVGLAVLLGRARRATDPAHATDLTGQAHDESQRLIDDLRELVWRVYPAALDDGDLAAALEPVVDRSPVPVTLTCDAGTPSRAVATAAYFVVSETLTNVAKHAGATRVDVTVRPFGAAGLDVRVRDDGSGGARLVAGGGLDGLARRVGALDGALRVDSPAGGPTTITAELPGSPA